MFAVFYFHGFQILWLCFFLDYKYLKHILVHLHNDYSCFNFVEKILTTNIAKIKPT